MKCIQCGTNNNLKERIANRGRCKRCHHQFAFEPTKMNANVRFTDQFFANLLNDISANNTLYFTPKQLFYLSKKRLATKKYIKVPDFGKRGCGCFLIFVGFLLLFAGIGLLFIIIGVVMLKLGGQQSRRQPKSPRAFSISPSMTQAWLERWNQVNPTPEKLLPQPRQQSTPATIASDITAYSFDRLLVCDSAEIAQMLIANNFHFDNNCAVLSITGYPQSIFATTMQMLRNNPDLRVYGLHNCSSDGMKLVHQLKTDPNWFAQSNVVIVDVGLLPRQIMATKGNILVRFSRASEAAAKTLPIEISQNLLFPSELEWLESGNLVELESFTPLRLMQILNRSIARSRAVDSGHGEVTSIAHGDIDSDNDNSFYVIDSFG
ncbi:MAG: hypothetical protein F6K47_06530 [Symploca sp. SIO2E6]|nr:hypothetical protein [Symploca sp. SIO2E6]